MIKNNEVWGYSQPREMVMAVEKCFFYFLLSAEHETDYA